MREETAVNAVVQDCYAFNITIPHGCARTIAAWYNDGADTVVYSFVSTGAIHESDTDTLWGRFAPYATEGHNPLMALREYLYTRHANNEWAPVAGWSDMWVKWTGPIVHYGASRTACGSGLLPDDRCVTDIKQITCAECSEVVHRPV